MHATTYIIMYSSCSLGSEHHNYAVSDEWQPKAHSWNYPGTTAAAHWTHHSGQQQKQVLRPWHISDVILGVNAPSPGKPTLYPVHPNYAHCFPIPILYKIFHRKQEIRRTCTLPHSFQHNRWNRNALLLFRTKRLALLSDIEDKHLRLRLRASLCFSD